MIQNDISDCQSAQDSERRGFSKMEQSPHAWLADQNCGSNLEGQVAESAGACAVAINQHHTPLLHGPKFRLLPAVRIDLLCRRYRPVTSDRLGTLSKILFEAVCSMAKKENWRIQAALCRWLYVAAIAVVEPQCTICHGQSALSSTYSSSSVSSSSAQTSHKSLALQSVYCSACLYLASWTY